MTKNDIKSNKTQPDCGKNVKCKTLVLDGNEYSTRFTKKFENRVNWEKPDPKKMFSFIPGTIQDIKVKEGEKVEKGQELLTLEAMKMMNTIFSPVNGTIKKIHIHVSNIISKNTLMLEFE